MAISDYYVDPAIAGNSGTGTSGDPFGDLQYALNSITRNSTDGDRLNIKAGTDEMLAASLELTTYGTPTRSAPLILRGYTSATGDGGIGGIDCNASYELWAATTNAYIYHIDLHIHNSGAGRNLVDGSIMFAFNCELNNSGAAGFRTNAGWIVGCYVHDCAGIGIQGSKSNGTTMIVGNHLLNDGTKNFTTAISGGNTFLYNVVRIGGSSNGITCGTTGYVCAHNSLYGNGTTGDGITASGPQGMIFNNIVEGFSGTGGRGFRLMNNGSWLMMANAAYNNTTNYIVTASKFPGNFGNNDTLGASAFVNAASGDFDINGAVTGVTEDGFPLTWLNLALTAGKVDKGASQAGAGAGGGGGGRRRRLWTFGG